jgi:hypothetical protein
MLKNHKYSIRYNKTKVADGNIIIVGDMLQWGNTNIIEILGAILYS